MLQEYHRLEEKSAAIKRIIQTLPDGKLLLCSNGRNKISWFKSNGPTKEYIKKKNIKLAQKLAYKKFLTSQLEESEHEMRAIKYYLDHHQEDSKSDQEIEKSSEFQKLLSVNFTPLNQELNQWMQAPYEKNKAYSEHLKHETCTGELVRSKSEEMIYNCLCRNQIPFRYECELRLGDTVYHPDFTIRHPRTGQIYYWEHLGRMDKPKYIHNSFTRLESYAYHGIVPSINLITTYETKEFPLSMKEIEKIVEEYFL